MLSSPFSHNKINTTQVMQQVMLATIPGMVALTLFFGWGTLINTLYLMLLALGMEALVVSVRKRQMQFYLGDCSALVTAILLGLALPPGSPWWLGFIGIFFAIVIAKHLYGGLGYNPFNPAMVAYVVLLISFPVQMSTWISPAGVSENLPDIAQSFSAIFTEAGQTRLDAFSGATVLDEFKLQRGGMQVEEFWLQNPLFGSLSGIGWEWVNAGFLLGGLYLMYKRIISWRIPVAMLVSIAFLALIFYDGGSSASKGSALMHLFGGATMLGAFFIATDPVSASTTPRGQLIYGALVGTLVFVIRSWGNYPDGVAFAVLLGNFCAPLIDHYTQPRTFGHAK